MLVLKRNVGTRITIGNSITIMVTDAGPGWAKLGIEAPQDVDIHREEVFDRIQRESELDDENT